MRTIVRPITDDMIERAKSMGINPERLQNLLHTGNDYAYDGNTRRVIGEPRVTNVNHYLNNENHHMIKPDPDGCFYLKVTIKGKTIVKPLHKDAEKAREMRDSHLKQLNFTPSRHSAR
jgi:hypothetical protein